jgi:hypothetical protein
LSAIVQQDALVGGVRESLQGQARMQDPTRRHPGRAGAWSGLPVGGGGAGLLLAAGGFGLLVAVATTADAA